MTPQKLRPDQVKKLSGVVKKPSLEKIKGRLVECRRSQRLNFSSLEMSEFPPKVVSQAKGAGVTTVFELDLQSNFISSLPTELVEFRTLRVIRLDYNCFHEIPKVVFAFTKLQVFSISNNGVKEIDMPLEDLIFLREIDVSSNELTTVPIFWTSMASLVSLNLAHNKLASVPPALGGIKSLQHLDLSDNFLTSIPEAFENLQELVSLDVHGNKMAALPTTLCHLKMLQKLDCGNNPLDEPGQAIAQQGFESYMGYLRTSFEEEQVKYWETPEPRQIIDGKFKKFATSCNPGLNFPIVRVGHSISQVKTKTFIFGGFVKKYGKVDELVVIDSRTMRWSLPMTNGCPPPPRDNHSAAYDGKNRLYFFGGRTDENKHLNDFYYLDLQSMTWVKPVIDGNLPTVRENAAMVAIGANVVLFGGHGVQELYNDLIILNTEKWIWTPQSTRGVRPCPRKSAAMVAHDTKIFLHGGKASLVFDDMYILKLNDFTWCKVPQERLQPRYSHTSALCNNFFYIIGGFDASGSAETSLWGLRLPEGEEEERILKWSLPATLMFPQERTCEDADVPRRLCYNHNTEIKDDDALCWNEMECAAVLDLAHTFSFHENKLIVMAEDAEGLEDPQAYLSARPERLYWHVYVEVELECIQTKVCKKARRERVYRKVDRVLHHMCQSAKLPKPFQRVSSKEAKLLEHVKRFSKTFMQEYPERRPLMLLTLNECGVQKFICSLIRPSQMVHAEFYNWEGAASFVCKYLDYEPLESPMAWPLYIPTPSSVLEGSRGDCFDFSITLVSLLIGVGYDALCVVGYAPIKVTSNDQLLTLFVHHAQHSEQKLQPSNKTPHSSAEGTGKNVAGPRKYKQSSNPVLSPPYLAQLRRSRSDLVREFVRDFLCSHEELTYGRTDEQDVLLNYISERSFPKEEEEATTKIIATESASKVDPQEEDDRDTLRDTRLHCWVMICSGKREVTESFFVEPTTGYRFALFEAPYLAVEFVFSHQNVWINLQSSSCVTARSMTDMSWDFTDVSRWEKILDSSQSSAAQTAGSKMEESAAAGAMSSSSGHTYSKPDPHSTAVAPNVKANVEGNIFDSQTSREGKAIITSDAARDTTKGKGGLTANLSPTATAKRSSEDTATAAYHWLLPLPSAPRLVIPMDAFVTRFRKGVKKTVFYRCEHFIFAFYGDYMRWDGLIERVLFFADDERTQLIECHDYFQRRNDKLKCRICFIISNTMKEIFAFGTRFGIKEILTIGDHAKHFIFYPRSRVDGLERREEVFGQKLTDVYDGRQGNVIYRIAEYEAPHLSPGQSDKSFSLPRISQTFESKSGGHNEKHISRNGTSKSERKLKPNRGRYLTEFNKTKPGGKPVYATSFRQGDGQLSKGKGTLTGARALQHSEPRQRLPLHSSKLKKPLLPIAKITQGYSKPAGDCRRPIIKKEISTLDTSHIQVNYYYIKGRITCTSRLYDKDGSYHMLHVDPFQPTITEFARMDEFHKLTTAERESVQAVRDAEIEIDEILEQRSAEEQNVVLIRPYFDIGKFSTDQYKDEEDMAKVEGDYLSSFYPASINPRQHLTRPQMIVVRDNCLRALKERFLRREKIIQSRIEHETTALTKMRSNFERDREGMTVSEEEEYEKSCAQALFRIRILQQRLKHHEQKCLDRYKEMEKKLQSDPRFSKLYQ